MLRLCKNCEASRVVASSASQPPLLRRLPVDARLQIAQLAQPADDAAADRLDHSSDGGLRRLALLPWWRTAYTGAREREGGFEGQ
jgi:hypothetical protein